MNTVYYIMSSDYATYTGANYDDDKWILTGTRPNFNGDVVDLSQNDEQVELLEIIEQMRITVPSGKLLIIPRWFGQWLYANHDAFKPKQTED